MTSAAAHQTDDKFVFLKSDREKADSLFQLALEQFKRGKFDSTEFFLEKGYPFAAKTGDDLLIANYLIQKAYVSFFKQEYENGLSLLRIASPHAAKSNSYELNYKHLYLKGRLFENLHQTDSALHSYHQLEALNNRENPYKNWSVYYLIACMYKKVDAYEESEQYFLDAYRITKPVGIRMDHGSLLSEFADMYFRWGKPEQFAGLLSERAEMMQSSKRDFSKDPVHSMLFIDWKTQPLDHKVAFMKAVEVELRNSGHREKALLANNYIANFYEEAQQPDSALVYIRKNQKFLEEDTDIVQLYSNTLIAYRLLKQTDSTQAAIREADRLFTLKDSIIQIQHRENLLDLQAKYETEKKDQDILVLGAQNELSALRLAEAKAIREALTRENLLKDSVVNSSRQYNRLLASENQLKSSQLLNELALKEALSRENHLKEIQLAKERKIRMQLIIGASLLLLSGMLILVLYRQQSAKKLIIKKQADHLEVLIREIHHRVKNNLQVISSLLDLQSLWIKDSQASEAIKESRNRVFSMALIHQNLYKKENFIGIEMNDYIDKLVQNLFQSYKPQENSVVLETDIDPLLLDVEMVIPIGLVLNELISNSLKYAFKGNDHGKLQIALKNSESEILLKVKDNGVGFPFGMNVFTSDSFGYKLVKAFAKKLKAKLEVFNDNGACTLLHIQKMSHM
ncbi:hypothetical protein GCM10009119_11740 [Algoriphagus jejuensis]|uniref:histidine kinase n=2 Tax=Algoriphagus jejuensis TaxID=419934 RepID=A0ABP3Y9R3_9BACT